MASISSRPNGHKWIQFFDANKKRQTLRLGKCSKAHASSIKHRVEQILNSNSRNFGLPQDTLDWLNGIGNELHEKISNLGLIQSRLSAHLGPFIEAYIALRSDLADRTIKKYKTTKKRLAEYFGADKSIQEITAGDAVDFRHWLGEAVAANTVNKHIQICKTIFNYAVKKQIIRSNPFDGLPSSTIATKNREHFVTLEEATKVLDACPNLDWKILFALARFGGLRCPSEPRELKWSHIDLENRKVLIHSPKTKHSGKPTRKIPLFPELADLLMEAKDSAESEYVLPRLQDSSYNPGTHMRRIVEKALGSCWNKVFQNCRSTRQTELQKKHPTHVVTSWLGNSARIAHDYYLQVTDEDYRRALDSTDNKLRTSDPKQNPKQHSAVEGRNDPQETKENREIANPCGAMQPHAIPEIAVKGLEPSREYSHLILNQRSQVKALPMCVQTMCKCGF